MNRDLKDRLRESKAKYMANQYNESEVQSRFYYTRILIKSLWRKLWN